MTSSAVLARIRRFMESGASGQIILNVSAGPRGRVCSVEIKETMRMTQAEEDESFVDKLIGSGVAS